jgi:tryptophan synthase beta chain
LEAIDQLDMAGVYPDIVIGCVGGGSNFGGIALPFVREKLAGKQVRIIAVEPAACPSLTRGVYAYDFGDTAGLAPLVAMHTLGHNFMPAGIHSGGLRYHGMSPLISHLYNLELIEARAFTQRACFEAGLQFARAEGIIPAPEPTHAIRAAVDEAVRCREEGVSKTILFNLSGHGHFDMGAWDSYLNGTMVDYELPDSEIQRALKDIESMPKVPVPA